MSPGCGPPQRHLEGRSAPQGGLSLVSSRERCGADLCRPLHCDKPGLFKILHKALGDDLRHDLIRVVDALAAFEPQREGERVGKCRAGPRD